MTEATARLKAVGGVGAALAREAATIAVLLGITDNTRVLEAAEQAERALDQLDARASAADDAAAHHAALWAMTSAAIALTEARNALAARELRHPAAELRASAGALD